MGRTMPTYRKLLEEEIEDLSEFRDALRARERRAFDEIMEMARNNSDAASNQASLDPRDSMYLSILIEMKMEIEKLKRET
ncbi:MAG: Protein associated with inactivated PolB-like polymerase [Candidatus Methanohalarchaeum thermophilum]|uniref:Protein associated with inactivated PolB-like polymerase n=1 Tax=Methanohalarchaeum thermophilum TaxID=1903181 RepID=A0A1Q6DS38_METT1|nr:MAG: Protein associated with inactivated PolB-like polymerase [Candidatus Methanohalarchaeum thermophilum]